MEPRKRPKHLDLTKIRLPVPGLVSILHRVSGAGLFLLLPLVLCLLERSLRSAQSYDSLRATLQMPLVRLVLVGLLWALLHHLFAGIRFLALDLHKGTDLHTARATSRLVLGAGIACTVILGAWLW